MKIEKEILKTKQELNLYKHPMQLTTEVGLLKESHIHDLESGLIILETRRKFALDGWKQRIIWNVVVPVVVSILTVYSLKRLGLT